DVINEQPTVGEQRCPASLHDGKPGVELWIDVGLPDSDAIDEVIVVLLDGADRRTAAVGHARGDHDGIAFVDLDVTTTELVIEDREGELDRAQHVLAPILLRVLLRMRMLEGEAVRCRSVEGGALGIADISREVRVLRRRRRVGALAADLVYGIVLQVVRARAGALVGIGNGTAELEAPLPGGGDGAIHTARA